jgi:VanZ family protein
MALIMSFSTNAFSAEHTGGIIGPILKWIAPWLQPDEIEFVHGLIRKLAHLSEYGVLGLLWFRALVHGRKTALFGAAGSLLICVAWAALDEWHQSFVPSRTASVVDVAIDLSGALVVLIGMVVLKRIRR